MGEIEQLKIIYPRIFLRNKKSVNKDIDHLLAELHKKAKKGLHIGAGNEKIEGLINCDFYNPNADMKVNATDLKMFPDNSIDLIENHHMIEHLSFKEAEKAFKEWSRVLKPRGFLVITCPDITKVAIKWLEYSIINYIHPVPARLDYILKMFVGSQEHDGMYHKSAYDPRCIKRILPKFGFKIEFIYAPYQIRATPSFLTIARKLNNNKYLI